MKDYLVRGLGFNGQVRVFAACTTATVGRLSTVIIRGLLYRQPLVDL